MKESNKAITVQYMGKSKEFTLDDIKTIWDPTKSWQEATKDDPDEAYLYQYNNVPTLYIKYSGIKLGISKTLKDFQ